MWCRKKCVYMVEYKKFFTTTERQGLHYGEDNKGQVFYR